MKTVTPDTVNSTAFFAGLGGGDKSVLSHWLVWEVLGVPEQPGLRVEESGLRGGPHGV